jgi:hypothetical protein
MYIIIIIIIIIRAITRNLLDFSLFYISPNYKICPSTNCATTAHSISIKFDNLRRKIITLRFDIIVSSVS